MKIQIIVSSEYADMEHIKGILEATVDSDNDEVFVPAIRNNGNDVVYDWLEHLGNRRIVYKSEQGENIPLTHNRISNEVDMVIIFAAGTLTENNAARNAISANKELHVFQNPLPLTS